MPFSVKSVKPVLSLPKYLWQKYLPQAYPKLGLYVRSFTDEEREKITAGLKSNDNFVLRRCQILLFSSGGFSLGEIAAKTGQEIV